MTVVHPAHATPKTPACHCSPNPHHPCVHTVRSKAAKARSAAKAKKTLAANTRKRKAYTKAHPHAEALAVKALVAKNAAAKAAGKKPLIKPRKKTTGKPKTKAQLVAAHKAHHLSAIKAAKTRAANKAHPPKKAAAKKPYVLLALPKKHAKSSKRTVHTNPHVKAAKAAKKKC